MGGISLRRFCDEGGSVVSAKVAKVRGRIPIRGKISAVVRRKLVEGACEPWVRLHHQLQPCGKRPPDPSLPPRSLSARN